MITMYNWKLSLKNVKKPAGKKIIICLRKKRFKKQLGIIKKVLLWIGSEQITTQTVQLILRSCFGATENLKQVFFFKKISP